MHDWDIKHTCYPIERLLGQLVSTKTEHFSLHTHTTQLKCIIINAFLRQCVCVTGLPLATNLIQLFMHYQYGLQHVTSCGNELGCEGYQVTQEWLCMEGWWYWQWHYVIMSLTVPGSSGRLTGPSITFFWTREETNCCSFTWTWKEGRERERGREKAEDN